MRLYLELSPATHPVFFNYQKALVGVFHNWLGDNKLHDGLSLYSISWLTGGKARNGALIFPEGAKWFISSPDRSLIKILVDGIFREPEIKLGGMKVQGMTMRETPDFGTERQFFVNSPILVKKSGDSNNHHFTYDQPEADEIMTNTLLHKLTKAGMGDKKVQVQFDRNYRGAKTKLIHYGRDDNNGNKGIGNRANLCPVILKGDPEAISFAWDVGVGSSTGIGFGALV